MSSVEALKARLLAHSMRAAPDCLDRITAEQWDVYQETAAVCKGAECANQAAAGNFGRWLQFLRGRHSGGALTAGVHSQQQGLCAQVGQFATQIVVLAAQGGHGLCVWIGINPSCCLGAHAARTAPRRYLLAQRSRAQ
eukprot:COSAG01_NODE_9976_length_2287_cov_2.063528_1_plen_138_part_00